MANVEHTVKIIFDAVDNAGTVVATLGGQLGEVGDGAGEAAPKVKQLGDEVGGLGSHAEAVDLLSSAFTAMLASIGVREFIDANIEAERLNLTLTTLTGSTDAAAAVMAYIQDIAGKLGVDVFELGTAFANFMAVTKGTALEGAAAQEIFEAVASTMAVMGKSTADTVGVLSQLGQGVSKGKFELEDLKSIAERGVPIFNLMAESLGVSNDVLFEMISAGEITGEVMLQVAGSLNKVYGGVQEIDTFEAAWNRLSNTLKSAAVQLGESGAMDAAKKGVEGLTLSVVGSIATFQLLGGSIANLAYTLSSLDFEGYQGRQQALVQEFSATVENSRNAFLGLDSQVEAVGDTGEAAGAKIKSGMEAGGAAAKTLQESAKEVDAALKKLGIDPKDFVAPFEVAAEEIQGVIADMVNNPATSGDQMLAGLLVSIEKLNTSELPALAAAAQGAFESGALSADQYDAALYALATRQEGLWESMVVTTDATGKQSKAMKEAEDQAKKSADQAAKYELELLRIASNEKIKIIESRFKLNIAEVEANAKIATAIIDSISQTYAADVSLIGDLMNQVTDGYSFADRTRIAMAKESSDRVEQLHSAQMRLIAAQVEYMQAKTAAASAGNPLVTIQADGLKPHLEAFMWEILGAIQVKMAYDGGDMLVGGCSL